MLSSPPSQKLMDVKHPEKYGFKGSVDKDHLVPETVSEKENIAGEEISVEKGLLIYTGIKIGNAFKGEDSESNDKLDIPSGLRIVLKNGESLDYTIALEDSGIYYISKNGSHAGTLSVKEIDGKYYALTEDRVTADSPYVIYITLSDVRTDIPHFTDPEVRQSLGIYWVSDISSDDVYAVIFPKYPSERDLHISFTDFSDIRGYSSKSFNSWNVLKMKVYEDGAFRDSSNPVYVEGSLNPKDRGSDGSFIGFSGLNASYRNQNLVCVYPIQSFNEDLPPRWA